MSNSTSHPSEIQRFSKLSARPQRRIQDALEDIRSEDFRFYIDSPGWQGGDHTNHKQSYYAFLRAASLPIEPDVALAEVIQQIEGVGGRVLEAKLKRSLERAYQWVREQESRADTSPPAFGDSDMAAPRGTGTHADTPSNPRPPERTDLR